MTVELKNKTILYEVDLKLNPEGNLTLLYPYEMKDQNKGFNISKNISEYLGLKVISSEQLLKYMKDNNVQNFDEYLEFKCTFVSFMNKTMKLSLKFKNPLSYNSRVDTEDLL